MRFNHVLDLAINTIGESVKIIKSTAFHVHLEAIYNVTFNFIRIYLHFTFDRFTI